MKPNGRFDSESQKFITELVGTLIAVIEEKDPVIREHSDRVARNCVNFARFLYNGDEEAPEGIDKILFAGLLHDIGMVYIPMNIINKPGRLSPDEWVIVRQHPVVAEKILSKLSFLQSVMPMIRHHHESIDGSGYPDGLSGTEIPPGAQILGLVDTYDAMTSNRPHRPAMEENKALEEIYNMSGKNFDPKLAGAFINYVEKKAWINGEDSNKGNGQKKETTSIRDILNGIVKNFQQGKIELPILPNIVSEIQKLIADPNSAINDLVTVVEKDAVVSLRIISVANSTLYRGIEETRSVRQAITRLGFAETKNIVNAIATQGLYRADNLIFKRLMERLWRHSLCCACGAITIAETVGQEDPDKLFLMGLIHDIGKTLLLKTLSQLFPKGKPIKVQDIIANLQPIHCSFGGALLQRWGFKQEFVRIATLHESSTYTQATEPSILIVNVADQLCRNLGYSLIKEKTDLSELPAVEILQLEPDQLEEIVDKTAKRFDEAVKIF